VGNLAYCLPFCSLIIILTLVTVKSAFWDDSIQKPPLCKTTWVSGFLFRNPMFYKFAWGVSENEAPADKLTKLTSICLLGILWLETNVATTWEAAHITHSTISEICSPQ
jgi:hypothetical protein